MNLMSLTAVELGKKIKAGEVTVRGCYGSSPRCRLRSCRGTDSQLLCDGR